LAEWESKWQLAESPEYTDWLAQRVDAVARLWMVARAFAEASGEDTKMAKKVCEQAIAALGDLLAVADGRFGREK